ncbi:hypothetical protein ABIB50_003014 [Mucilaginibacter sp. UYCu711]
MSLFFACYFPQGIKTQVFPIILDKLTDIIIKKT